MIDFQIDTEDGTITNDEVELILQQIDILFDTNKYEVLGEPNFGTSYDNFLYETCYSNDYIREKIMDDITANVELFGWQVDVDVTIMNGTENDIILVSINLSNDSISYSQNYKIR